MFAPTEKLMLFPKVAFESRFVRLMLKWVSFEELSSHLNLTPPETTDIVSLLGALGFLPAASALWLVKSAGRMLLTHTKMRTTVPSGRTR